MELRFVIELLSDYHIGAGFGSGVVVDSALQRDADGVPVIRGSTLAGLIRDGMRRLLDTTPELQAHFESHLRAEQSAASQPPPYRTEVYCREVERCPLCRILGTPAHPKPWRFGSARPVGQAEPLGHPFTGGSQPTARVRMDPGRRRALDRHLFVQEEGRRDLQYLCCLSSDGSGEDRGDEAALLVAAARMVRRLGSARRRGRGDCRIHLATDDGSVDRRGEEAWLTRFRKKWIEGKPASPTAATAVAGEPAKEDTEGPRRFQVLLRTDEPVVIGAKAIAGNLFRSKDYISGTSLWGALAARSAQRLGMERDSTPDDAFVELFYRGGVEITPLYPAARDGRRLYARIPAPLDLLTCKHNPGFRLHDGDTYGDQPHGARGFAVGGEAPGACELCDAPLAQTGGLLTVKENAKLHGCSGALFEEMHPRIDPRTQRAATGDLYGYEALGAGQFFLGELKSRNGRSWEQFKVLAGIAEETSETLHLGKAIRRGYGAVTLWLRPLDEKSVNPAVGLPLAKRVSSGLLPLELRFTLLSDTILRDPWGRFLQTLEEPTWLQGLFPGLEPGPEVIRAFCRTGPVDGFAGHLGLPRWRDLALLAGSSVGLRFRPPAEPDGSDWRKELLRHLERIETEGIGLRRHEGFGRVVFNHPIYEHGCLHKPIRPVELPDQLVPHDEADFRVAVLDKIVDEWNEDLDFEFDHGHDAKHNRELFADRRWAGVARWLHTNAGRKLEVLEEQLASFGDPVFLKAVTRDNWFKAKGMEGLKLLKKLLRLIGEKMDDYPEDGNPQQVLIHVLAERLANLADKEAKAS